MRPGLRLGIAVVAAVVLAAVTVWCLLEGVETRPSTGGLLTAPVPLTRLSGAWLLGAAVAGTAAVLAALDAATAGRSAMRHH